MQERLEPSQPSHSWWDDEQTCLFLSEQVSHLLLCGICCWFDAVTDNLASPPRGDPAFLDKGRNDKTHCLNLWVYSLVLIYSSALDTHCKCQVIPSRCSSAEVEPNWKMPLVVKGPYFICPGMGLCCGGEGWGVSVGRRKSSAIQSLSTQRKGLAELVSYNSVTIPLFIDQLKLLVWHRTVSDFWHRSDVYSESIL